MVTANLIATCAVLAVDPKGREFTLTLGVGQPYAVSPDDWACAAYVGGLYDRLADQHGIDSWQSLQLAYQLIARLVGHFVQSGGQLFWPEGREPISLPELIPHLSPAA